MHDITREIYDYVERRVENGTLVFPSTEDALLFCVTELAEASEVLLARKDYVRNNPKDKPSFSQAKFGSELGDVILMCIVAGISAGADPMASMLSKVRKDARADTVG
jgi:hypothetical protein